ncbi:hypothetical protein DERP_010097 [Dermatophagoides pteronyssinus]|uniref:Uncharacterized protein n=1 Tax=Dermatophagoides pteronyssinus TaxID=6956 RepID=A0ABQ8JEX2_DERPT|nr:hypothetical protein DERP_010097 [Dermatophagoides pteronyssinus]
MNKMGGVRRGVRGSFRGSLRRYGSAEYSRRPYRHHNWIFRNGEWRIAFDDGDEVTLMYAKLEVCNDENDIFLLFPCEETFLEKKYPQFS